MSDLLEISLTLAAAEAGAEAAEAAAALFDRFIAGGAAIELGGFGPYGEAEQARLTVRGYVADRPDPRARLAELAAALAALPHADRWGELSIRPLAAADWAEAWKAHYQPLRVGRVLVTPTWLTPASAADEVVVRLDPGMAFGTGMHPSTQLLLRLLPRYIPPLRRVLDVGTGSGILAIAAAKLGAGPILATDIDPEAAAIATANAAANDVAHLITCQTGSLPASGAYDLICANILADVIADLLLQEGMHRLLAADGVLLLSGIIAARSHVVDLALAACGLTVAAEEREGDWVALACTA